MFSFSWMGQSWLISKDWGALALFWPWIPSRRTTQFDGWLTRMERERERERETETERERGERERSMLSTRLDDDAIYIYVFVIYTCMHRCAFVCVYGYLPACLLLLFSLHKGLTLLHIYTSTERQTSLSNHSVWCSSPAMFVSGTDLAVWASALEIPGFNPLQKG